VVKKRELNVFRVNSTLVVIDEVVGHVDAAADGAVLNKLGFHLLDTSNVVVLANVVFLVGNGAAVGDVTINLGDGGHAVSAHIEVTAGALEEVCSFVLLT